MSDDLVHALSLSPLCQDLTEEEVADVASRGRVERWPEGARLMEEGHGGPRLVILLEGRVQILRLDAAGLEQPVAILGPGDVLGEMSLLCDVPGSATALAVEPLRVFAMDRSLFKEMIAENSAAGTKVAVSLARVLAHRLIDTTDRVVALLEAVEAIGVQEEFSVLQERIKARWDYDC